MKLKYNEFIENINREKFIVYYRDHNIKDTANFYNTSITSISKYCKEIGYKKSKFNENVGKISKEELYQYYIVEDHEYEETAKYFGISTWSLDKLKKLYNIKKDKSKVYKKFLNKKWEEVGSKEEYYKNIIEKTNQTHLEKYGSLDEYQKERSKRIAETWNNKTPEEKQKAIQLTLAHGGGWNHKTALKTLKEKYGVNNSYALATFKSNSKLNEELELKLIDKGLYESKEFILRKPEGYFYRYDFKFDNVLIELNPIITHNSTFNIFGDPPLDPLYHYNKTKLALNNDYKCICIWDWDNIDEVIKLIQSNFTQIQLDKPKRHLYNLKTKEHLISETEPLKEGWVEIFDDGSIINKV